MTWWRHRWLLVLLAVEVPILLRFFTPYPDTWDAAEYSWCLKKDYLPHSPYLVYFLLGRSLHLFLSPPVALSLLSFLSGALCLILFYLLLARTSGRDGPAAVATLLLAASAVFVRESTHQEVYALQTAWILLSLVLVSGERRRPGWSGAAFGAAVATHGSSLFVAPAFLFFVRQTRPRDGVCPTGVWVLSAILTVAVAAAFVVAVLPVDPGASRLDEGLRYLAGIGPGLDAGRWDAEFLARSLWGQLDRLFALGGGRVSASRYAVGFTAIHLVLAGVGAVRAFRRRRASLVWCLYPVPYLLWELLLGASPDVGSYLPLVAPAVCALAAEAVSGDRQRLAASLVVLAVAAPSVVRLGREWNRVQEGALDHFSSRVLAASWLDAHLPADAVVVNTVPSTLNAVAYYSGRDPVLVDSHRASIFRHRGRFTPINKRSFHPLSTEVLADVIRGGRIVVAFAPDPFREVSRVDGSRFEWRELEEIDLAEAAALDANHGAASDRLVKGRMALYRAFLKGAPP